MLVKKFFSPSLQTTPARWTKLSPTANRSFSAVLGAFNTKGSATLFISRAALTASLRAKKTEDPKKSGGSPVPLLLWIERIFSQLIGFPSESCCKVEMLNTWGISEKPVICQEKKY
jgi:hypothetical protein